MKANLDVAKIRYANTEGIPACREPVTTEPKGEVWLISRTIRQLLSLKRTMEFAAYITGFADGEGSFSVSFNRRSKLRIGIEVRPSFAIAQNAASRATLEKIREYFGCGGIRFSARDRTYKYEVRSIQDLVKIIIPHFDRFPLQTAKRRDFANFKIICQMVSQNRHLNHKYLTEIIDLAFAMNPSGKRRYNKSELLKFVTR